MLSLIRQQAFYIAFVACGLRVDVKWRGSHQWDISLLTLLETLEVDFSLYNTIMNMFAEHL